MRMLLLLILQIVVVLAETTTCIPFGECVPCPVDALHEPFCQPFGNRRLVHCSPNETAAAMGSLSQGETPAWQSCGRIVARERADYYEFVGCNLLFAAVAVGVALVRSRMVEARQARRVAARIGLGRSPLVDER